MKITEGFLEKSLFPKSFIDLADLFEEDDGLFVEILTISSEEVQKQSCSIIKTIVSLKVNKFQEARINIKASHNFDVGGMNEEFKQSYRNIKSLITGIVLTSSIIKKYEIEDYQKEWSKYAYKDGVTNFENIHHQKLYKDFKQVHTLQELVNFNAYFQQYILDLIYAFAKDFLTRTKYTYEYLEKEYPVAEFLDKYKELYVDLSEKIKELKLK